MQCAGVASVTETWALPRRRRQHYVGAKLSRLELPLESLLAGRSRSCEIPTPSPPSEFGGSLMAACLGGSSFFRRSPRVCRQSSLSYVPNSLMELWECLERFFAMTSTHASKACCLARHRTLASRPKTTGCLSKRCGGLRARAAHGGTCLRASDAGTACTSALPAGRIEASGIACSRNWPKTRTSRRFFLTRRSSEPTSMLPVRLKKRRPGDRPLARWAEHEDSQLGRRAGQSGAMGAHARPSARPDAGATTHRGDQDRGRGCRQGLRCQRAGQRHRAIGGQSRDSSDGPSSRSTSIRPASVQASQPHRALLLPPQAVPPHRHPIRQTCRSLLLVHRTRRQLHLVGLIVNRP